MDDSSVNAHPPKVISMADFRARKSAEGGQVWEDAADAQFSESVAGWRPLEMLDHDAEMTLREVGSRDEMEFFENCVYLEDEAQAIARITRGAFSGVEISRLPNGAEISFRFSPSKKRPPLSIRILDPHQIILIRESSLKGRDAESMLSMALCTLRGAITGMIGRESVHRQPVAFIQIILELRAKLPHYFPQKPPTMAPRLPETLRIEWIYWQMPRLTIDGAGSVGLQSSGENAFETLPKSVLDEAAREAGLPEGFHSGDFLRPKMLEEVYVKFADLPVMKLREFLAHPALSLLVPSGIDFPSVRKISDELKGKPWLDYSGFSGKTFLATGEESALLEADHALLSWIERRLFDDSTPVYIGTEEFGGGKVRRLKNAHRVSRIEWSQSSDLAFRTEIIGSEVVASVSLQFESAKNRWDRNPLFRWDAKDSALVVDPSLRFQRALSEATAALNLFGHQGVTDALLALRKRWTAEQWSMAFFPDVVAMEVRPQIWLEPDGAFKFALVSAERNLRIWNLPTPLRPLFLALEAGPQAFSRDPASDIATRTQGEKRRVDMKVLRHAGIARILIADAVSIALTGKTFSGETVTEEKNAFRHSLALLGRLLEPTRNESLEVLCGKCVLSLLKEIFTETTRLVKAPMFHVFHLGEILELKGAGEGVGQLLQAIFRSWAHAAGDRFLKLRSPLRKELNASEYNLFAWGLDRNSDLSSVPVDEEIIDYAFRAEADVGGKFLRNEILALGSSGAEVFWDSKPVHLMRDEDFRAEFEVRDQASPEVDGERRSLDWFELHPEFFLQGVRISPDSLRTLSSEGIVEHEGVLYRLPEFAAPQLRRLFLFWERLQKGSPKTIAKDRAGGFFAPLPRSETLELLAWVRAGYEIRGSERFMRVSSAFAALSETSGDSLDLGKFQGELKPYQEVGVRWLLDLHAVGLGGILADDMGLGKTVQILAFLSALEAKDALPKSSRLLLVVPMSLVGNWRAEAHRFAPHVDFEITTYGQLTEHEEKFLAREFDLVIFDEAQSLKNFSAKRTMIARQMKSPLKFALTGTPMENHWGEFYSILDLVCSGSLGSWTQFRGRFLDDRSPPTKAEISALRERVRPLMLRRTKAEVLLELPKKIESKVRLEFEAAQKKIYSDAALSWSEKVRRTIGEFGEKNAQLHMLTALMRLRQICSDPTDTPGVRFRGTSPKMDWLLARIEQIAELGESGLIFGQFISTLERVKAALEAAGFSVDLITGSVPARQREKILERFRDAKGSRFLLMTLKTGGVGLNLTRASHVIHLDPWWNPAAEHQATDRAHRMGQTNVVQVHRLFIENSVEEKIEILQGRKQASFDALLGSAQDFETTEVKSVRGRLSQADFELLITAELSPKVTGD